MRDFSEIEDSQHAFEIIRRIAADAGKSAAAEARAAGLPLIFERNNQIIRLYSDGKKEIVSRKPPVGNQFYFFYKPGTVLHLLKK